MKDIMEAPKNLYLIQDKGLISYCRNNKDDIKYIRKDAFIDKACEWLKSNLCDYAGEDDKRNIIPFDDAIFEDFKKAMEE